MEIKIVGSIPDETTLDEIQHIAKIFVYEQRMKQFKHPIPTTTIRPKPPIPSKEKGQKNTLFSQYLHHISVKGLM